MMNDSLVSRLFLSEFDPSVDLSLKKNSYTNNMINDSVVDESSSPKVD